MFDGEALGFEGDAEGYLVGSVDGTIDGRDGRDDGDIEGFEVGDVEVGNAVGIAGTGGDALLILL